MIRNHHLPATIAHLGVAAALGATLIAAAATAPALAQSPPAPTPAQHPTELSDAPLVDSGAWMSWSDAHTSTASSFTLGWRSNRSTATFEVSRSTPTKVNGHWRFPKTPTFGVIKGTAENSGTHGKVAAGKATYRFNKTVTGLAPATEYYVVVRIPVGPRKIPVERAFVSTTKRAPGKPLANPRTHTVSFKVREVHVTSNGDKVGKGEVRFGARMAPDANPLTPSLWTSWTHTDMFDGYKVKDGQTLTLNGLIGGHGTATEDQAFLEVQGYDDDAISKGGCWLEGGPRTGQQGSNKCRDSAVAQVLVKLPTTKGTHVQTVTARVYRSPDLRFTAKIDVTSRMN